MRSNRNSHNDLNNQKESTTTDYSIIQEGFDNSRQPHHMQQQQKGAVQLPPIDRKSSKPPRNGGAKEPVQSQKAPAAAEDKYEQMRNRSRNNAERLQKLKDIKSQYTKKNGAEKLPARKPPTNSGSNSNSKNSQSSREEVGNRSGNRVATQNDHEFEIFEMERVENNEENIANLLGGNRGGNKGGATAGKGLSAEDEIEALERELAQLRGEISDQQSSIAKIDEISKMANNEQSGSHRKGNEPPPIDKNQVFGQRVKGKEISDYWNGQEQKAAFKIQQVPGGQSQVHIGDAYNFFKDKENSNYIASKLQNKAPIGQAQQQSNQTDHSNYNSAGAYQSPHHMQQQQQQQQSRKQNPNDQGYNIINPSNENSEQKERQNARTRQQQQQEAYSQQLREQIASNTNNNNNGKANKNAQSINIFDGYPSNNNNNNNNNNKNDKSPAFISSLYHQQERERNNPTMSYNNQATDITADGKKNVRVSQPPGGISQITFF